MTTSMRGSDRSTPARTQPVSLGNGWTAVARVLLLVVGALNVLHGIVALTNADYYSSSVVYDNLTFWGWAFIVWGAMQVAVGVMSFSRTSIVGPVIGVFLGTVGAVMWMFMIFSAPTSALVGVALNVIIICGLLVPVSDEL